MVLLLPACAKVNLFLRVTGRRPDGYHEIATVFQRLSLADIVSLTPAAEIAYEGPALTDLPEHNLCLKAARAYQGAFDSACRPRIGLAKRIPAGAGLGGGSSDAAAVMRGLAGLTGVVEGDPRLRAVGALVGSDVPFFLMDTPAASARGRGEELVPVAGLDRKLWVTVLWPGFGISTTWAYKELDKFLTYDKTDISLEFPNFSTAREERTAGRFVNDFELPVFSAYPELREVRDRMLQAGALMAGLAGSGSALFGIFDGEAQARTAASGWRPPWQSFVCRPC